MSDLNRHTRTLVKELRDRFIRVIRPVEHTPPHARDGFFWNTARNMASFDDSQVDQLGYCTAARHSTHPDASLSDRGGFETKPR